MLCMNNRGRGATEKMLALSYGAQVTESTATALNDWGMGRTAGDGGILHGRCTKFCLTIRILGWDYLTESFKSLSCTDECCEFPPDTRQGVLGTALSLQVSGFSPVPRTLGIWKRLGTWVTDQPFFNILPQA